MIESDLNYDFTKEMLKKITLVVNEFHLEAEIYHPMYIPV